MKAVRKMEEWSQAYKEIRDGMSISQMQKIGEPFWWKRKQKVFWGYIGEA